MGYVSKGVCVQVGMCPGGKSLKPVSHWKLGSRWVPNAREQEVNNMKCIYAQRKPQPTPGDPTQPIFH